MLLSNGGAHCDCNHFTIILIILSTLGVHFIYCLCSFHISRVYSCHLAEPLITDLVISTKCKLLLIEKNIHILIVATENVLEESLRCLAFLYLYDNTFPKRT